MSTLNHTNSIAVIRGDVITQGVDWESYWDNAVNSFMAYLRGKGRSRETRRTYLKGLKRFFSWVYDNGIRLNEIDASVLVEYRDSLSHLSNASANVNIVSIRRFFGWMARNGYYENIAKDLECYDKARGFKKQPLTMEEQERLLDYMRTRTGSDETMLLRDYAIVNLLLRCGLRSVEVTRANVGDMTEKYGQKVLMVWGKGHDGPDTPIALTPPTYGPIEAYLESRGQCFASEPLFACEGRRHYRARMSERTVQAVCKDALRAIGLDSHAYSTHSLRHSTGTTLLKLGASLKDVQYLLRHRSDRTTLIYVEQEHERQMICHSPQSLLDGYFMEKETGSFR